MPVLPSYRNQSICFANQLTGFYMSATLAFNGLYCYALNISLNTRKTQLIQITQSSSPNFTSTINPLNASVALI